MSALMDLYIKKDTLKTLLDTISKKDEKGIALTISISNETNQYGQNTTAFVSQTKEQREANKSKFYVGNGKVFWNDGKIQNATKDQQGQSSENDDLPF